MNTGELREILKNVRMEAEDNYSDEGGIDDTEFELVNQKLDMFEEVFNLFEQYPDELAVVHELSR